MAFLSQTYILMQTSIILIIYLAFIILVIYFVVSRVNKFLNLKQEHNQLLREIAHKMDKQP